MTFTGADITALVGALAILVAAIGVAASKIIAAVADARDHVARVEANIVDVDKKVVETLAETLVVKGHVNSASTKAATEADSLRKEMEMLRAQLGDEKQRAALLAQSVATIAQSTKNTEAGMQELNGHPPAAASLKKIDHNTEETAKNTARTEAVVEQLKEKK